MDLVYAGTVAVAGDAQQACARRVRGAHAAEPLRPFLDDAGCRSQSLDVVDAGRFAEVTLLDREGWFQPGRTPFAFARLDQRRLFTAHIGAGTHLDTDVEIESRPATDIGAEQAVIPESLKLSFQIPFQVDVFGTEVDDPVRTAGRVGRDDHPHEHVER